MAKSKGRNQKEYVCVCLSVSTVGKINEPQCHFDNFSHPKTNNPNAKEPKGRWVAIETVSEAHAD